MATKYVILQQQEGKEKSYDEIGVAEGGNERSAVTAFLATSDGKYGAGKYRGVPARSWADEPLDLKPQIKFV
jgi:hypothetical protein